MANLTNAQKDALEALAVRAETASTWMGGPRSLELASLATDIRGVVSGDADLKEVAGSAAPNTGDARGDGGDPKAQPKVDKKPTA